MAYLREYTKLTPQEKRANYYKTLYKKEYPDWDESLVLLNNLFNKFLPGKNLRVLDAWCGNGNWVIDESKTKISYAVGVDVDKAATLKNKCVDKIVISNLDNIPLPKNSFDAAVSLWVAEHLSNPVKVFKEVNRILKPGGYFLFVTPSKNYALILIRRLINTIDALGGNRLVTKLYGRANEDIFPTFYRANTITDLKTLAKKANFEVVMLEYNFDPSYTSFNSLTYKITKLLHRIFPRLFEPHLIGVFKKTSK